MLRKLESRAEALVLGVELPEAQFRCGIHPARLGMVRRTTNWTRLTGDELPGKLGSSPLAMEGFKFRLEAGKLGVQVALCLLELFKVAFRRLYPVGTIRLRECTAAVVESGQEVLQALLQLLKVRFELLPFAPEGVLSFVPVEELGERVELLGQLPLAMAAGGQALGVLSVPLLEFLQHDSALRKPGVEGVELGVQVQAAESVPAVFQALVELVALFIGLAELFVPGEEGVELRTEASMVLSGAVVLLSYCCSVAAQLLELAPGSMEQGQEALELLQALLPLRRGEDTMALVCELLLEAPVFLPPVTSGGILCVGSLELAEELFESMGLDPEVFELLLKLLVDLGRSGLGKDVEAPLEELSACVRLCSESADSFPEIVPVQVEEDLQCLGALRRGQLEELIEAPLGQENRAAEILVVQPE